MDHNATAVFTTTQALDEVYTVSKTERIVEACVLVAIAATALVGNVSLWFIIVPNTRLRTCSNALILCLSGADILVSSVNMPVIVYTLIAGDWRFSDGACIFLGFLTMITFIASVMSLAVISINRYILICQPNKYKTLYTPRKTGLMIAGVWLLAFVLASPPLYGWAEYGYIPGQSFCFCVWKSSVSFTFFMVVVCFGGPCITMTFSYINILREIRKSRIRVHGKLRKKSNPESGNSKQYSFVKEERSDEKKEGTANVNPVETKIEINQNKPSSLVVPLDRTPSYKKATKTFPPQNEETPKGKEGNATNLDESTIKVAKAAQRKREKIRNEEIRLTTSFLVVILTFVISWLPFCVTMFWSVFSDSPVPRVPDMITLLLGCFNSCCNPIIYGVMNSKFRIGFKKLYCECPQCKRNTNEGTSSSYQNRSSSYA